MRAIIGRGYREHPSAKVRIGVLSPEDVLDKIREKGIVLDSDDYLAFEFTMGLKLDSDVVRVSLAMT